MSPTEDQYRGALVGLALGDALGAPYEGGSLERLVWRLIGSTRDGLHRYSDDTQMSLDLAQSLLACGDIDQGDLARRFSLSYRWHRGYGPGAARMLKRVRSGAPWQEASRSVYPAGSFGNGAAMRSPVVGMFFHPRPDRIPSAARLAAEVTHAHPLGVEGAVLIAEATAAALDGCGAAAVLQRAAGMAPSPEYAGRLAVARAWLEAGKTASPAEVRAQLGMGITGPESCVTAVYLAGRYLEDSFEALLSFVAKAGGDVDTVGAMAGALWGARNGSSSLPAPAISSLEDAARIGEVAVRLFVRSRDVAGMAGPG